MWVWRRHHIPAWYWIETRGSVSYRWLTWLTLVSLGWTIDNCGSGSTHQINSGKCVLIENRSETANCQNSHNIMTIALPTTTHSCRHMQVIQSACDIISHSHRNAKMKRTCTLRRRSSVITPIIIISITNHQSSGVGSLTYDNDAFYSSLRSLDLSESHCIETQMSILERKDIEWSSHWQYTSPMRRHRQSPGRSSKLPIRLFTLNPSVESLHIT